MNNEKNFNEEVVKFLKQEEMKLQIRCNQTLDKGKFNEYKNLINAYERVVELIKRYDWQLMYSNYGTKIDGERVRQVAVWKQNGDGIIKNHKIWNVESDIKSKYTLKDID